MRRALSASSMVILLLAGVTGFSILSCPSTSGADEYCIMFLDDLFHPLEVDESRDPWEERIETDRHDFTQSPRTVGRGVGVIETGYTYYYEDTGTEIEQSHVTPEMMLRVGLTEDIEFRVMWNYAWRSIDGEDASKAIEGAEDLRWSFKLRTTEQAGSSRTARSRSPPRPPREVMPGRRTAWSSGSCTFTSGRSPMAGRSPVPPDSSPRRWAISGCCPRSRPAIVSWTGCSRWPGFRDHRAQHDVRGMVWSFHSWAGR